MLPATLRRELRNTLNGINNQIEVLEERAKTLDVRVEEIQNPDGSFVMAPLLLARAQVLNGMAVLHGK